jgi:hypothetical protein
MEHTSIDSECFQTQIKELAELCDYEYYMSALPIVTSKERAVRGRNHILQVIEEFKNIQKKVKCLACGTEINKQMSTQEQGLKEIAVK